ncbi:hypothetical protein BDV93DRAFT_504854 [Ceratobasidium sp. AG-I]|nr:hypothetical protein BDV93DRAFT_504854 [Ceratobasidium sp. AG-I]
MPPSAPFFAVADADAALDAPAAVALALADPEAAEDPVASTHPKRNQKRNPYRKYDVQAAQRLCWSCIAAACSSPVQFSITHDVAAVWKIHFSLRKWEERREDGKVDARQIVLCVTCNRYRLTKMPFI